MGGFNFMLGGAMIRTQTVVCHVRIGRSSVVLCSPRLRGIRDDFAARCLQNLLIVAPTIKFKPPYRRFEFYAWQGHDYLDAFHRQGNRNGLTALHLFGLLVL